MPLRLTEAEREMVLAELRRVDETLTAMGGWLQEREPRAAGLLMESWERLAEAGWLLTAGGLEPTRTSPNGLSAQF